MHELALADAVLEIAREHARGRRVTSVAVRVGRLRQVVPEALEFSFEVLAAGTNVEGAALEIEQVPVRVECSRCGGASGAEEFPLACERCGNLDVAVVAGDELYVEALELEDEPIAVGGR
jgi:hydrogenase nickel incorporation protein HypA/HybF